MTENTSNETQAKYSKDGQAALNAIKNATSREALQSAIRDATSMSERIPGLSDAIASAKSKVESNIIDANIAEIQHQADAAQTKQPHENIIPDLLKPQVTKIDLKDKESVTKLADEAGKWTGKTDEAGKLDSAYGETLRAIKAQEEKDKARLSSSSRLQNLQEIAEKVKKGESVEGVDKKTLKAAKKVATLDKGKIEQAREVRQARDNFDDLNYALSGVFDETKSKPKALEDVPDASKPSVSEVEKKPLAEASQREEKQVTVASLFGGISDDDFEPAHAPSKATPTTPENNNTTEKPKTATTEAPQPEASAASASVPKTVAAPPPVAPKTQEQLSQNKQHPDNLKSDQEEARTHTKKPISVEQSKKWVDKVQQPTETERTPPDPNKMRAIWPPVKANMSPPATPEKKAFAPHQVRNR